jgi:hypothetical protein
VITTLIKAVRIDVVDFERDDRPVRRGREPGVPLGLDNDLTVEDLVVDRQHDREGVDG